MTQQPREFSNVEECVEAAVATIGKKIVLGAPLGLGKPNQLINAFYQYATRDPSIDLTIFTALSLEIPRPTGDLEARFLDPFIRRNFGDHVELEYVRAIREDRLPANIRVHEFYFKAGSMLNINSAQRHYISTNYTFVARDLIARGVNLLVQLVAERDVDGRSMLSLSSNTDISLDVVPMLAERREAGEKVLTIAQTHRDLPFMYNKAMVEPTFFDWVVRNPAYDTTLFATPNMSVNTTDMAIGFRASTLVRDGGTLQIGIGSLGDAVVYGCCLRHDDNQAYRGIAAELDADGSLAQNTGGLGTFDEGLYGCSEMFVSGFLELRRAGILSREVFDEPRLQQLLNQGTLSTRVDRNTLRALVDAGIVSPRLSGDDVDFLRHWGIFRPEVRFIDGSIRVGDTRIDTDLANPAIYEECCTVALGTSLARGIFMHGGFFLGPTSFYSALRNLPRDEAEKIGMDSVRQINRLAEPALQALQRRHARFINSAMMVTLSGAVVSDGLENGQVVSGVGGQYNFVAQAHELGGARSIICLRATRGSGGDLASNIVPAYGHVTISRHLRDIVVTEYGIADLRGKTDEEIVQGLLEIADSRFQEELLHSAVRAGKVAAEYVVPERHRKNLPGTVDAVIARRHAEGFFPTFPLGTDFTAEEIALAEGLREIKALMDDPRALIPAIIRAFTRGVDEERAAGYLERIGLQHPNTPKELILQHLLLLELEENGHLGPL